MVIRKNNIGDHPNSFVSASGSGIKQLYIGEVQKDGKIELVPAGKKNLYAEIQSYADMVDINKIIQRYKDGEIDILNQIQGTYGDVSNLSNDPAEALRVVRKAEREFYNLPLEIRNKFNNNPDEYIATAGSQEWFDKHGLKEEEVEKVKNSETEVKTEE